MARENPFLPNTNLKPTQQVQIDRIRETAFELLKLFPVGTRETALAITKLEESVMWGVKGVCST